MNLLPTFGYYIDASKGRFKLGVAFDVEFLVKFRWNFIASVWKPNSFPRSFIIKSQTVCTFKKLRWEIITKRSEEIKSACKSDQAKDKLDGCLLLDTIETIIGQMKLKEYVIQWQWQWSYNKTLSQVEWTRERTMLRWKKTKAGMIGGRDESQYSRGLEPTASDRLVDDVWHAA